MVSDTLTLWSSQFIQGIGCGDSQHKRFGLTKILFTHRNHKLNKQAQETQKQYAYLSVTYIQIDNHTDLGLSLIHI